MCLSLCLIAARRFQLHKARAENRLEEERQHRGIRDDFEPGGNTYCYQCRWKVDGSNPSQRFEFYGILVGFLGHIDHRRAFMLDIACYSVNRV